MKECTRARGGGGLLFGLDAGWGLVRVGESASFASSASSASSALSASFPGFPLGTAQS